MSNPSGPEPVPSRATAGDNSPAPDGSLPPLSPENLPPVQPPSAGFILQLFVVPAIIVGAVIAIWLLFGRLASSDQDWRRQVDELKQSNEHRRWRAADSLVKMLDADANAGEAGQRLADNPELAAALVEQLSASLAGGATSEDENSIRTFLIMALGRVNSDANVVPALVQAMESQHAEETRFTAIASAATIASRRANSEQPSGDGPLADAILTHSSDPSAMIRRISAFALGFFAASSSQDRLVVLLDDPDPSVRANAAMSLAVQKSTLGLSVLVEILNEAVENPSPLENVDAIPLGEIASEIRRNLDENDPEAVRAARMTTANAREIELTRKTLNAVKAASDLAEQLSGSERARIRPQLEQLASEFRNVKVRSAALEALRKFPQ